ncbi:MFS transporter [Thiobacter aerophilum]|uniref:MFS transporter n=1 Tax=Thiobacter aerophilum TaxID=3121275 RepID=A0ABV0EKN8_9BURK
MTTLAVVKKKGQIAIAADTLTKWGTTKESATYIANHEKIIRVGDSHIAITGTTTFNLILRDYFASLEAPPRLDSVQTIFRTWQELHAAMKERYFLNPAEDKEDDLESSRIHVLIANPHGIFGVGAHRTVQEFSRFYAYGAGSEYAMGALWASYDNPKLDAHALARLAIECAIEFDDSTGAPITSYVLKEARR